MPHFVIRLPYAYACGCVDNVKNIRMLIKGNSNTIKRKTEGENRVVKRKLDAKNLKFIPISEVPEISRKKTQWEEILSSIPQGEAVVIPADQASPATVRSAVSRYQKRGKFTQLRAASRKIKGEITTYILNPEPEQREGIIETPSPVVPTERLPSDEEVFEYITSKPAFAHTLGEIHKHFFGRKLSSRDPRTRPLYHQIRTQVFDVQGKIEREYGGKFESTMIGREKRFIFKEGLKTFA